MDRSLRDWFAEYDRLSAALRPYCDRIFPKTPWQKTALSEPERVFSDLWFYWSAALVNNGDVFGWLDYVIKHEADFVAVSAHGTLQALAKLKPLYQEQQNLRNGSEEDEFWQRTKDERVAAVALAEDVHGFARLLLAFAEKELKDEDDKPSN